jgi:deazaflavin-dependent oxidoreductase (nitroreductase family)
LITQLLEDATTMVVETDKLDPWTKSLIEDMRAHGGTPSAASGWAAGKPFMVLTTKGAKSGQERVSITTYHMDGDRWIIGASKGGADENPQWYYNLKANPETTIEVDNTVVRVRATEATGAERDRLWNDHVAQLPEFGEYPKKTSRVIPMFVLERID